jgi:hypothetical protein
MNDIQSLGRDLQTQSETRSVASPLRIELAKMLGLVAPVTMTADQCAIWLASAEEALQGIRASEVSEVSMEVRRLITRHSQIVPKISDLVAERRSVRSRIRQREKEDSELRALPRPKPHIADRDRRNFGPGDWAELNIWLESQGSKARYRSDGTRYFPGSAT